MTLNSYTFPCILRDAQSPCSILQHLPFCWQPGDNSESPAFSTGPSRSPAPPFPRVPQLGGTSCTPSQPSAGARNICITLSLKPARRINEQIPMVAQKAGSETKSCPAIPNQTTSSLQHCWAFCLTDFFFFFFEKNHPLLLTCSLTAAPTSSPTWQPLGFLALDKIYRCKAQFCCVVEPQHN